VNVTNDLRPVGALTEEELRVVILAAMAAPSLHNSQPWHFRCAASTIELWADMVRELPASDPDHREVLLACGAALLNLRLAIKVLGVAAEVHLLPSRSDPDLLAVIRPEGFSRATTVDQQLRAAIPRRHTNRRPFLDDPVPDVALAEMRTAARVEQAWFAVVRPEQQSELRRLLSRAYRLQRNDPAFVAEFKRWTGRDETATEGVPLGSAGLSPAEHDLWLMRDFGSGEPHQRVPGKDFESDPVLAVIGTLHDRPLDQLQAGEAMQRVLLTATANGLATSFLSQVIEVPGTRDELRHLLGGGIWPQTVLRIGYGTPAAATPRRGIDEVVTMKIEAAPPVR